MRGQPEEQIAEPRKLLTGFFEKPLSRPELMHQLAEAGLELWHAPEGFWAVRLKPAPVFRPGRRSLRRTK